MTSLELFDETLDINSTENYELAVQAGPDGVSYSFLDTLRNKVVLLRSFEPEENKYFNAENINEIIGRDEFLSRKYKKIRVVTPSPRFTFVPSLLFDPARKNDYFILNHKQEINEVILSNKSSDPDAFAIFSVRKTIKDVLEEHFPGIYPFLHIVPLMMHISKTRRSIHGNYIHVHVERDYFNLIIFGNNELKFSNTFKYRNISDILYYVLNVFTKLGLKQDETIHFSGVTEKYDDLTSGFAVYIKTIRFSEPRGNFTFSYVFNELEKHRYLNLFSLFNCA